MAITADTTALALFGTFGWQEILLILAALLLLFGGKKLPELAKGLGRGLHLFKKEIRGVKDEVEDVDRIEAGRDSDSAPPRVDQVPRSANQLPSGGQDSQEPPPAQ